MFKNAKDQGWRYAAHYVKEHRAEVTFLDEIIFKAIEACPFTSNKAKTAFFDGASDYINMIGRIETAKSIYTTETRKYWN